ncbi:hypothetical protein [Acuticoccus sediminis]|nr:hypothetical protein [Acuticoccus sediminis]
MSGPDWRAVLTAQGVDAAVVDQAEQTAGAMAAVAAAIPHDPTVATMPADIVRLLLERRDDT